MPRNVSELRELSDTELLERLESHKEELFNLRFQLATGQLDNPMRVKQVRHDVARILTVLHERNEDLRVEEEIARVDREAVSDTSEEPAAGGRRRGLRRLRRKPEETPQESPEGEGAFPADETAEAGETREAGGVGETEETEETEETGEVEEER
jgi:large subunit ribosomal protein L29